MLSPTPGREVCGSIGRQLWVRNKEAAIAKLQLEALAPNRRMNTFAILPMDVSNFLLRFGNTPVADEYYSAIIDYLHAATDYRFVAHNSSEVQSPCHGCNIGID